MGEKPSGRGATINIVLETEKNLKEKKYYPLRNIPYHPNLSVKPLTGKFYARHDQSDECDSYIELEEAINKRYWSKPKDRLSETETENQEYGWLLEPFIEIDRSDRRFYHTKVSSWVTQIGTLIDIETKKHPKKPFTGIPFKL